MPFSVSPSEPFAMPDAGLPAFRFVPLSVMANLVANRVAVFSVIAIATGLIAAGASDPAVAADEAPKTVKAVKPDLAKGETIATGVCVACHGPTGNSPLPVNPKLAGQHVDYLYKQLVNFKAVDGEPAQRENAIMAGFAGQLTDQDMRAVAAFYSSQTLEPAAGTDKALAEAGQAMYRGGDTSRGLPSCAGCHGPAGAGIPGQYPGIAGQHAEYTAAQLTAFRQGGRKNSAQMTAISATLSDNEIKALSDYIAGLRTR